MSRAGSRARCASTLVMVFVAVAVAPRACAAANAWKAAENKLRQEGLLVDDAGLPDDGESAAAVEAGPAERVSPAEEKFRAARDILSEFTTRHRRNARAVGWLREALALDPNHREAMTLLGRAYQMGEGVEPDEALAMEHFRRAADLGDPGAHFELGFAYSVGWVRPRATRRKSRLPGRMSARKTRVSPRVASPNRTLLGLPSSRSTPPKPHALTRLSSLFSSGWRREEHRARGASSVFRGVWRRRARSDGHGASPPARRGRAHIVSRGCAVLRTRGRYGRVVGSIPGRRA